MAGSRAIAAHQWSRRARGWLGLATAWPLAYVLVFLAWRACRLWFAVRGWHALAAGFSAPMAAALGLHVATLVLAGLLTVVYAIDLAGTPRVVDEQRLPWVLLLLLLGVVVMPAYWYLYVWREPLARRLRPPRER